jgi:GntR family transcriptional regulator
MSHELPAALPAAGVADPLPITPGMLPKYRQLLNILRAQIVSGQIAPGDRLPTEEELSALYGLSRGTVRRAVEQLEAERLIHTEHGIGSFVATGHPRAVPFHFNPETPAATYEVLAQRVLPANAELAERLKLPLGEPLIHVARRRRAGPPTAGTTDGPSAGPTDGQITGYSERYLAQALCPALLEADLTTQSVHSLLVSLSTLPLLRAEFEVEAHVLASAEAALLRAEAGSPAIVVTRLTYTAPNRPAVWYRGLFRERYSIDVELG